MNSSLCLCPKADIAAAARCCGACAVGFAAAEAVDAATASHLDRWIASGRHATMDYMARNRALRLDPRLLLPGASTVISLAFSYRTSLHSPYIADYALCDDYHIALREALVPLLAALRDRYGATSRLCIDSAPVLERYWAVRAGIGFIGLNRQLIVPGIGSKVFLCEIITTLPVPPDEPCRQSCGGCRRCIAACPGQALSDDGIDARRCLSYLTTERIGTLPPDADLHGRLVGCDTCADICPHNTAASVSTEETARQPVRTCLRHVINEPSAININDPDEISHRSHRFSQIKLNDDIIVADKEKSPHQPVGTCLWHVINAEPTEKTESKKNLCKSVRSVGEKSIDNKENPCKSVGENPEADEKASVLSPRSDIAALTPDDILAMTPSQYKRLIRRSALRRLNYHKISENARLNEN